MGLQGKKTTLFKLKGLRAQKNFTQSEVADMLNVSKATYARKENGLCQFYVTEIDMLIKLFNVKYEDIFCSES